MSKAVSAISRPRIRTHSQHQLVRRPDRPNRPGQLLRRQSRTLRPYQDSRPGDRRQGHYRQLRAARCDPDRHGVRASRRNRAGRNRYHPDARSGHTRRCSGSRPVSGIRFSSAVTVTPWMSMSVCASRGLAHSHTRVTPRPGSSISRVIGGAASRGTCRAAPHSPAMPQHRQQRPAVVRVIWTCVPGPDSADSPKDTDTIRFSVLVVNMRAD